MNKNFFLVSIALISFSCGDPESSSSSGESSSSNVAQTFSGIPFSSVGYSGLSAIDNVAGTSVRVNWNASGDAKAYLLYNVTNSPPKFIAAFDPGITAGTVTGLSPDTDYQFRVRLMDSNGYIDANENDVAVTTGPDQCYRQLIIADGPVAYYQMNETSGTTATDFMNSNDGTYGGGFTLGQAAAISTETGTSVDFNGSDGHIDLGNPSDLQITGDQTIEMWVRPASFANRQNPWAKAYGGEGTITIETNRSINYFYGTNGGNGTPYQGFNSSDTLTLNTWTHIVLVRDLTNTTLRWYMDGVETANVAASYSSATAGSLTAYIGQGYVNNFNGQIDHVAIYNKALSAANVLAHYNAASTCP